MKKINGVYTYGHVGPCLCWTAIYKAGYPVYDTNNELFIIYKEKGVVYEKLLKGAKKMRVIARAKKRAEKFVGPIQQYPYIVKR